MPEQGEEGKQGMGNWQGDTLKSSKGKMGRGLWQWETLSVHMAPLHQPSPL